MMTLYRMTAGDVYREKAADMAARAQAEASPLGKAEYERLALGYMHLAEQADRNSLADEVSETPPARDEQRQARPV